MTRSDVLPPGSRRWLAPVLLGLAVWLPCAWLLAWLALPSALCLWIFATTGSTALGWRLLLGWRPLLFLLVATLVGTALLFLLRLAVRTPKARLVLVALLTLPPVGMAMWQLRDLAREPPRTENRWGFHPSFAPRTTLHIAERGRPIAWDFRTNSEGYRAPEWHFPLDPDRERVLLVGDSFVYGFGISGDNATLDRRLEAELARRDPAHKRDVLNLAQLPAGLWYYTNILRIAARETHPRVLVMSFLGCSDLEPFDLQRVWYGRSERFMQALRMARLDDDIMVANKRATEGCMPEDSPEMGEALRADFDALLTDVEHAGARLIVWEPIASDGKSDPFFDPWRKRPALSFVNWERDVLPLAAARGEKLPVQWPQDPSLGIVGDGHPTARANALFAEAIAAKILAAPSR